MIVTATQYADSIGYSPAAITKRLKKDKTLPYATKCTKWGNTWQIELPDTFNTFEAALCFKVSRQLKNNTNKQ